MASFPPGHGWGSSLFGRVRSIITAYGHECEVAVMNFKHKPKSPDVAEADYRSGFEDAQRNFF